jgi:nucleotide-binding universal stress UspA family protein
MISRPSVLCPVDFSEASRGALRYAAAVCQHFYAELTIVTVDDPLLTDAAAAAMGPSWLPAQTRQDLEQFIVETFAGPLPSLPDTPLDVRVGRPAPQILQSAMAHRADLLVMSTHGTSGIRKLVFGSTTERVLRETHLPVLVTPPDDPGPQSLRELRPRIRHVLVPVDLSDRTALQLRVAQGLAEALDASLVLTHVRESIRGRAYAAALVAHASAERREHTDRALKAIVDTIPARLKAEVVTGAGDPASEIARVARERNAGIIVMGLHSTRGGGPRIGSVTYRLLCNRPPLVLALPPSIDALASVTPRITDAAS